MMMCGRISARTTCRITRCTTAGTRVSAARPARARCSRASTNAPDVGGGNTPKRKSAGYMSRLPESDQREVRRPMPLFPIFVKLDGRRVLLVGAGPMGESKIQGLLAAGAGVTVVSPDATVGIQKLAAEGAISWHQRVFEPADLDGAALVIAAVPKDIARQIYDEAHARGVLVNSVDDPDNCDFYYPAVVNRGDLQIAISTSGHSPALAQRIRIELEQQFGPEYTAWVRQLGDSRRALFAADMDAEARKRMLHEIAGEKPGMVYLIGAGPGDPDLLTLKALRILGQADVVLHDDLLTPEILELVPATARIESVGKRHNERQVTQQEINDSLCRY